jgi:hypothetical protein
MMAVVSVYLFPPLSSGGAQVPRLTLFPHPPHRTGRVVSRSRLSDECRTTGYTSAPGASSPVMRSTSWSPGGARSCQALVNLRFLDSSRRTSNQGSFPPRQLCCPPKAHRYDEPIRLPTRLLRAYGGRRTPRLRGISRVGLCPKSFDQSIALHRLGSNWGIPTTSQTELAPVKHTTSLHGPLNNAG